MLKVLLDEAWTEVNVDLYQRRVTNGLEAMDLTGLNDKDISRAALEGLAVDGPHSPAFTDELDLIIRMPVRPRSRTGLPMKQEHRNTGVALLSSNKLIRTTNKRQTLLAHVMHALPSSYPDWMSVAAIRFRGIRWSARGRCQHTLRMLPASGGGTISSVDPGRLFWSWRMCLPSSRNGVIVKRLVVRMMGNIQSGAHWASCLLPCDVTR